MSCSSAVLAAAEVDWDLSPWGGGSCSVVFFLVFLALSITTVRFSLKVKGAVSSFQQVRNFSSVFQLLYSEVITCFSFVLFVVQHI